MIIWGMVLKLYKDYALIVTDDSDFVRIKRRKSMRIGQKIFVLDEDIISPKVENEKRSSMSKYFKAVAILAACMAIVVSINNPFGRNTNKLYAMVSLDINPSLELGIDEVYNVVQINAMNEESKGILELELIGKPLSDAVSEILSDVKEAGYVLESHNAVLVATVNFKNNNDEPIQKSISDGIRLAMAENEVYKRTKVIFIEADEEDLDIAKEQKLSIGKSLLLEMSDDKIDESTISESRVSDLIEKEAIKEDLETDETIQIIDGEVLEKLNQMEKDIDDIKDRVEQLKEGFNRDTSDKIEKLLSDIKRMENKLIDELSEFEEIYKLIKELDQMMEMVDEVVQKNENEVDSINENESDEEEEVMEAINKNEILQEVVWEQDKVINEEDERYADEDMEKEDEGYEDEDMDKEDEEYGEEDKDEEMNEENEDYVDEDKDEGDEEDKDGAIDQEDEGYEDQNMGQEDEGYEDENMDQEDEGYEDEDINKEDEGYEGEGMDQEDEGYEGEGMDQEDEGYEDEDINEEDKGYEEEDMDEEDKRDEHENMDQEDYELE